MGLSVTVMAGLQAASEDYSNYSTSAKTTDKTTDETAADAVYEKGQTIDSSATYSVSKMSSEDRAALVEQLKADEESRQLSLTNLVAKTIGKQAGVYGISQGDDSIWKIFSSGNFTVTEAAKAQAQEDISEDGYWGVTQTSQRLFDFASALAGDDEDKMREMQEAMQKGFEEAGAAWGSDLPEISSQTLEAANALFDEYYKSKANA